MKKYEELRDARAVPIAFCERQEKWLPIEEHMRCEYCAAPVFDQDGDPVSFLCTYTGERRTLQSGWHDESEEGRGPPARPPAER